MATGGRGELFAVIRQSLQRTPAKPQNSVKKTATPRGKVKPANLQGTGKPAGLPPDTVQPDHLLQDTVKPAKFLQDTVKPANLLQDTAKPAYLLQDTVKPANPLQDTVKPANPLQDTVKPANLLQDTVKPAKPLQDTGKPGQIPQYTVKAANAAKLPHDTGKPAQLPQYTVKAANAVKLPQDTVVKPAKKKRKKKMRRNKKTSPKDLATVQRSPVCEEMAAQKAREEMAAQKAREEMAAQKAREEMAAQKARVPRKELSKSAGKSSFKAPTQNFMEMLPTEVLVKILSYLDVSSLDYISQVSKMFHQLASDDAIWQQLYMSEFGERKCWKPKAMDKMDMVKVQDRPVGYWKRLYRTMAGNEVRMWKGELKDISPYTGLPSQTKYVLRNRCISWELTVCDMQGKRGTFRDVETHFSESSVIVCWSEGHWPRFHQLSTLQIHGVMRRGQKKPGCQSLMAKFDTETLTRAPRVLGKDRLVKLVLLEPGFTVGIWRGQPNSIAFVMASFHFHKLVEKSLLGTPLRPYSLPLVKPPYDDIDPEYGLHGYRLHICLHNTATQIMSGHFSHLFSPEAEIRNGFIRLTVIKKRNLAQHTILSGNITLPWKCAVLEGAVENCCVLGLTLLDEFQKPFWVVSSPVAMDTRVKSPSMDYDGDHFRIEHWDPEGHVQMELVWMEEHKQYFLVHLAVFLSVHKVNKHFGRSYRTEAPALCVGKTYAENNPSMRFK